MATPDVESIDLADAKAAKRTSDETKKSMFSDEKGNLKFVNVICKYPTIIFFSMILLCFASTMILGALIAQSGNPITEETNEYDVKDARSIAYDTLRLAKEEVKEAYGRWKELNSDRLLEEDLPQQEVGDITYWIYESETPDGVFHPDAIPSMRKAEDTILSHESYGEYCWLQYDEITSEPLNCQKPLSAMNIYYASEWDSEAAQDIIDRLSTPESRALYNLLAPCVEYGIFCDELPETVTEEDKTWATNLDLDIKSVQSKWDGEGEINDDPDQVTAFIAYMTELLTKAPLVNFFFDVNFSLDNQKSMYSRSIVYYGELLPGTNTSKSSEEKLKDFILEELLSKWDDIQNNKDGDQEVQSYYFMGALIWDIILQILLLDGVKAFGSFVFVFFYLRIMLGSWFLTAVGMFEIFMSLPLAWISFSYIFQIKYFSALNVLCIFIVMAIGADDIFVFMDSYKQSANRDPNMLESLETRMSWVYRRSGSAMLLTSITTCSAFLCTLLSPIAGTRSFGIFAAFVIFFDYVLVMTLFCTSVVIYHNLFEAKNGCCNLSFWRRSEPNPTEIALAKRKNNEPIEVDRISKFFEEKMGPFILNGRNRLVVGIILLTWIVVSCVYTAKLRPTTSTEQFLDDNHPLQIGVNILQDQFPKTQEDLISKIHFVWGLNPVERKGVNQLLNPEFVGEANFEPDFIFDETCQTAILDACRTLQNDEDLEEFILRKDGFRSVDCFVEQLGALQDNESATCLDIRRGEWEDNDWQVPVADLSATLEEYVNTPTCTEDQDRAGQYYDATLGWDGTNLKFAGVSVDSSILDPRGVLAEDIVRVHYDKFVEVTKKFDESVGQACGTMTTMTDLDQKFVFMDNQKIYRTSAVRGSMVGVIFGFIVLFASTRKFHIALFATLSILSVLLGVIGSVTMLGWTLGTIEAILISILAGFSVDYVIHLAHAYHHAEGDVEKRVLSAYADMGISVFSGMLTSVVASIPLFFCTLTFFAKFGTFLCLTIVLAWIFANFGFMCLLAQFKISMDTKWL